MENKDLWIIGAGVLLLLLLFSGGGMMGFGMGFGIIFWILLIALIVYLLAGKEGKVKMKKEYYLFGAVFLFFLLILGIDIYNRNSVNQHSAMMQRMHSYMFGSGFPSFLEFNVLFWLFLAAFLILLLTRRSEATDEKAVEILKERYARGEISREEYLRMFKELKEQ